MIPSNPNLIAQSTVTANCNGIADCVQGGGSQFGRFKGFFPVGNTDLILLIKNLINFLLGFLGIILVVIILYAGFLWMTAGGDEKKITLAKDMIKNAVIGLAIVLSAWSISYFVINSLLAATTT